MTAPALPAPREELASPEVCGLAGVTYRQLNYWAARGYLRPVRTGHGSGHPMLWPADEAAVARLMARLVAAGLVVDVAARVAREHVTSPDRAAHELADGLELLLSGSPA